MHSVNNLFDKIISQENLYHAHLLARRHKRCKPEVLRYGWRIESITKILHERLAAGTWWPQGYSEFVVTNEVKRRTIHAPMYGDRVVHHALIDIVRPYFERTFIHDSYAVTPGKGTHRAVRRVQYFTRLERRSGRRVYVLQGDIRHYYPSINHAILLRLIARTLRDRRIVDIWRRIIDSFGTTRGLPIGSLTSQLAANIYLNPFDHFVKEQLHVKHYARYMDDFVIVMADKERLRKVLSAIHEYLDTHLNLELNRKTRIYPASHGIDFAGYRIFATHILSRKRTIKAAKLRFKHLSHLYKYGYIGLVDVTPRVASFLGYVKHCNAQRTTQSTLRRLLLIRSYNYGKNNPANYNAGQLH